MYSPFSSYPYKTKTNMPCVKPKIIEIIARDRCILRNLRPSFLRNKPARKVAKTNESVAIPSGLTKENNEKELL